jgi:hypothetical protein
MSNQQSQQQSLFNQTPLIHHASFLPPQEHSSLLRSAGEQEKRIVKFLATVDKAGASTIWKATEKGEPITSTRRALTNLLDAGLVVKLDETQKGMFGKSEHLWRVAK